MSKRFVHKLANLAVWSTLVLIAFGGFTRGSGSGYGCKDRWPLCENGLVGGWLPRMEAEMLIEWTHRWIALLVGVLAIVLVYAALKAGLDKTWVLLPSVLAVAAIGVQAWIGRLVVTEHLDRDLVALHLVVSMIIVALFVVVAVATRDTDEPHLLERDWTRQLALGAVAVLLVLLLGSLVHNIYVPGWPLVNGEWIPDTSQSNKIVIHWLHRMATAAVLVYLVFLVWRSVRAKRPRIELFYVGGATALFAVNVLLGLVHVLTHVDSSWVVATHLGIGGVVWAGLVGATIVSFHDPR